ncbi:MAG TPA: hypothetical protein VN281_18320 [Verrucomicrobiae bacterium]|jgi:hypothetical protein|nr:hypothetical protein [Verrucomicrobiae bacterium]
MALSYFAEMGSVSFVRSYYLNEAALSLTPFNWGWDVQYNLTAPSKPDEPNQGIRLAGWCTHF